MKKSIHKSKHVFISFSTKDKKYADKIIKHLQKYDISVWIDYKNLIPGTPDWDHAIKEAIKKSAVVILLVSPNSIASPFVKGEIAVATSRKVGIFPVWIHGESWEDCAPLYLIGTQYLDLRDTKLDTEIERLDDLILPYLGIEPGDSGTFQQPGKRVKPDSAVKKAASEKSVKKVKKGKSQDHTIPGTRDMKKKTDVSEKNKKTGTPGKKGSIGKKVFIIILIIVILGLITVFLFNLFNNPQNPIAVGSYEVLGKTPDSYKVRFDASKSYDPDGAITDYIWYIGNRKVKGMVITEKVPPKQLSFIKLVVIDNHGNKGSVVLKKNK